MIHNSLRDFLSANPFRPFRIMTSGGGSFVIRDSLSVALLKSEVFIAEPKTDKRTFLPLLHIAAIESLESDRGKGRSRRRKRS